MNPHTIRRAGLALIALAVFCFLLVFAFTASAGTPSVDQPARWRTAKLDPRRSIELDKMVARWRDTSSRYQAVQRMKPNGVPAVIAFCLFYREADSNFRCSPAQGDSLARRSVNEPKGRIPGKSPPYRWEDAAFDAYYVVDHLDRADWKDAQSALDKMESFNGFGYRKKGIAAPYLWAGTSLYTSGKYVRDGVFDRTAKDQQLGCAAIMLRMRDKGVSLPF